MAAIAELGKERCLFNVHILIKELNRVQLSNDFAFFRVKLHCFSFVTIKYTMYQRNYCMDYSRLKTTTKHFKLKSSFSPFGAAVLSTCIQNVALWAQFLRDVPSPRRCCDSLDSTAS